MVALLRDRFYEGYRRHMKNGYYPIPDREVMRDIYEQYHALGGNGVITPTLIYNLYSTFCVTLGMVSVMKLYKEQKAAAENAAKGE